MGLFKSKKVVEKIFNFIQCLVTFVTNLFIKPKDEYELSAMVYHVIWAVKIPFRPANKDNFIALFERFEHPSVLLEDQYTLYSVTDTEAIFVDCGGKDVFNKSVVFSYNAQVKYAKKMISISISSFHLIANQVAVPKIPIIHLANHGRCGSTLATKLFNEIPNILSISETWAFSNLVIMSQKNGDKEYEKLKQICRSVILMTIKHANTRGSGCVFLKCQSLAIFITDMMFESFPEMIHVFMYRQAQEYVRSWKKLIVANSWGAFPTDIYLGMCGIGKHRMSKGIDLPTRNYVENLNVFSKFALGWISNVAAYKYLVKKGYQIKSLKYEHLMANPEQVLSVLFEYVGLPLSKMPDIEQVMSKDSQAGTVFSSRSADQEALKQKLTRITDGIRTDVESLMKVYQLDEFWGDIALENAII